MADFVKIFLELLPDTFQIPPGSQDDDLPANLQLVQDPGYDFYKSWHNRVGAPFGWDKRDRINDRDAIERLLTDKNTELLLLNLEEQPVGYCLLELDNELNLEISDFGFPPEFCSNGYGTLFMPMVINHAFDSNAQRIWLSTRSTNHPKVIDFYKKFGFTIYKEESFSEELK